MKNPSSVALASSLVLQAYFTGAREFIEPPSSQPRPFYGPGIFDYESIGDRSCRKPPASRQFAFLPHQTIQIAPNLFQSPCFQGSAFWSHSLPCWRAYKESGSSRRRFSPHEIRPPLPMRQRRTEAPTTQAASRLLAAFKAPATAFSRCSGPTWIPSAEMNSGLATPMKPNTQRR